MQEPSVGVEALRFLGVLPAQAGHLHVTSEEQPAEEIVCFLREAAPDVRPALFPSWDCLPYDAASLSPDAMRRGGWRCSAARVAVRSGWW